MGSRSGLLKVPRARRGRDALAIGVSAADIRTRITLDADRRISRSGVNSATTLSDGSVSL